MRDWYANMFTQVLEGGLTALSDAYYPPSGSFIDMSRFEYGVFIIALDTIVTPDFQVYQDTSPTATGDIKVVTGAGKADLVTGDDGKTLTIQVQNKKLDIKNGFRWITLQVANSGGPDNAAILFIGYRAIDGLPIVQPTAYAYAINVAG